tara:strand:- start:341 stop:1801 length:1461 start_codon:yes stop_codon:yes gene_type:complete
MNIFIRKILPIFILFFFVTCDDGGSSSTGPEEPINTAPTAYNFNSVASKNVPTTIALIAADAEDDDLVYSIVATNNANVTIINGANVSYEPNNDFVGTDTFSYQANDGAVNSNVAIVTVIVSGTSNTTNTAPVAFNFTANATKNVPTTIKLNAQDNEGDNLVYSIIETGSGNTAIVGDGPNVSYQSDNNFYGIDTFTYQVSDGTLSSNIAKVTINILNQESYIIDINEYDHDGYTDGFSDSKLRASNVSYQNNPTIVEGTYTNNPMNIVVAGSTNFLIENRSGTTSYEGTDGTTRDFDRFNFMTSNWSVEINFNETSVAWDYNDGTEKGTVPFALYFHDNNTGDRYRGWIEFTDADGSGDWNLYANTGWGVVNDLNNWPGYEPVYGYLSMNEYDPANENQYISDNSLITSAGLGFGSCGNIIPYNGDICYPMLTAFIISSGGPHKDTMLPTAANHSSLGTGYNTGSAIFIRTGVEGTDRIIVPELE